MEIKKRERGQNFTTEDISILMRCIMGEIKLLENKATDGVTIKEKRVAWQRVAESFNAQSLQTRDVNTLKLKYENIKRTLKKKIATEKLEVKATGGGPKVEVKLTWYEEQLYAVLQLGIDGLPSQSDCDDNNLPNTSISDTVTNNIYSVDTTMDNIVVEDFVVDEIGQNVEVFNDMANTFEPQTFVPQSAFKERSSDASRVLKRKRSLPLNKQKENVTNSFNDLAKIKIEVQNTQKEILNRELLNKNRMDEIIAEEENIKQKILNMKYEIEKNTLESLIAEQSRKEKMFRLMEEEQNLKIEILKCELHAKIKKNIL